MAATKQTGKQIRDESIQREDLCSTVSGKAVIKRILPGTGISIESTGIDEGTGDVTISADVSIMRQYIHEQAVPESTWIMMHEFAGYPEAVIIDQEGDRVYCDLYYPNHNTVIAEFGAPYAGKAALTISKLSQLEFEQSSPSTTWVITHNLGRYPDVILFDTSMDNIRIYGDIKYISMDSINVVFNNPMLGKAYLI